MSLVWGAIIGYIILMTGAIIWRLIERFIGKKLF